MRHAVLALLILISGCTEDETSPIDIGPLLDTKTSFIADKPFEFYSGAFCFYPSSSGAFYILEEDGGWLYQWTEDEELNHYRVFDPETGEDFMLIEILSYDGSVYRMKLKQGVFSVGIETEDCTWL